MKNGFLKQMVTKTVISEAHAVSPPVTTKTYTGPIVHHHQKIVLRQSRGFWDDPLVRVWLMILGVALIAAIVWRILNVLVFAFRQCPKNIWSAL